MHTLAIFEFNKYNFDVVVSLIDSCEGLSDFYFKWDTDDTGLVIGTDGSKWISKNFSIGKLNEGFDTSVAQAQAEFNRDCDASDCNLTIAVSKNGVELVDEHVIMTDYNHTDDITPDELLKQLYDDYGDDAISQIEKAKVKILKLVTV